MYNPPLPCPVSVFTLILVNVQSPSPLSRLCIYTYSGLSTIPLSPVPSLYLHLFWLMYNPPLPCPVSVFTLILVYVQSPSPLSRLCIYIYSGMYNPPLPCPVSVFTLILVNVQSPSPLSRLCIYTYSGLCTILLSPVPSLYLHLFWFNVPPLPCPVSVFTLILVYVQSPSPLSRLCITREEEF